MHAWIVISSSDQRCVCNMITMFAAGTALTANCMLGRNLRFTGIVQFYHRLQYFAQAALTLSLYKYMDLFARSVFIRPLSHLCSQAHHGVCTALVDTS
jgi:hypothetical protein